MLRRSLLLATALVTSGGCATTPDAADSGSAGTGGKADGAATTITFTGDFAESASGPVVAGDSIRIAYDLDRVTDCRGSTGGSEVWGVTGYAQFDGGTPTSFAVSKLDGGKVEPVQASLAVPAFARSVAFWFEANNRWGCHAYDSNMGDNYTFTVEHHGSTAVLAFDADWTESQSDAIRGGDEVVVHYAPERLSQCAGSTGGHAAWGVTGYWQVDRGTVHELVVTRAEGADLVAADPTISVPQGSDLALWFEATSVWGCHAYDSDFGANYHIAIQ